MGLPATMHEGVTRGIGMDGDGETVPSSRRSFDTFFVRHSPHLVRLAYLLLGDLANAEDVAQEVLEQLYRRWDRLRADSVLAYARTAVIDRSRSLRRRAVARRFAPRLVEPPVATAAPVEDDELWQLVQRLPRRQREVVVLRYWCDLADGQIARLLGISTGTVVSDTVHRWPVEGKNPMWLDGTHVVLTQPVTVDDTPADIARCDLETNRCARATAALRHGVWQANPEWLAR